MGRDRAGLGSAPKRPFDPSSGVSRYLIAVALGTAILPGASWQQPAEASWPLPLPDSGTVVGSGIEAADRGCAGDPITAGCRTTGPWFGRSGEDGQHVAVPRLVADPAPERPACPLTEWFGAGATVEMSFVGQHFVIPRSYIFSFQRGPDDALVEVRWPSFGPLCGTKPAKGIGRDEWQGALRILLEDRYAGWSLDEWLRREHRVLGPRRPGGRAFGLDREAPGPGSDLYAPRDLYIGRENGVLNVVISCSFARFGGGCQQIFVTVAGTVQVSYSPMLLPHWYDIQCGIVALLQHWKK